MSDSKLVYMANQIATNLKSLPTGEAVPAIAEHIRLYWTPKMRAEILVTLDAGKSGLEPLAVEALDSLRPAAKA